jgi:type I restriction enzyme S subunit
MAEWVMKKLKDIADFNPRESLAKGVVAKKVAMDKLQPFCRDIPGYELEPFSGGTKFRNGDTIMARITPCLENGKTAKVAVLDDGEVGFGSTEYIVFRAKDGIDEDFIYYLVCSPLVREPAIKSMVGSSGRQRVQTDVVQNLEIMVPDYEEQKRISGILKSLDDKIAANTEVNKNLEQQAESLYKEYFAPVNSEMQNIKTLDMFCNIFTGKKNSNASTPDGKFKFFTCSPEPLQIDSFIFDGNAIIVSGNGAYTGRTRFYSGKFDLYQRTYACTLKEGFNSDYIFPLYWFVKLELSKKIMGGTRGSAIPYIVMNDLAKFEFEFDQDKFESYMPLFKSITETIQANENQNETLAQLRDGLLPRLMSGELDVSDIEL